MYRLLKILVPTDFSRHSEEALEHAAFLGAPYHAEITILHVDEFSVTGVGQAGAQTEAAGAYRKETREFFSTQFERLTRAIQGKSVSLQTEVREGRAYKVIVEESERIDYDLIIISTRGQTHLASDLIGSTAERVVRLSRQPVLSVQQGLRVNMRIESILCPTDLSPAGNVALSYALSIARQNSAVLYIQHITELERPEDEAAIRARLPDLRTHHPEAEKVRVEYVFDRDLEPSNSIIRFSEDRDVSLIVMSTHGQKGLRRVHIGNNAAEVVRQSRRPVLTVAHPFHRTIFARPLTEKSAPLLR